MKRIVSEQDSEGFWKNLSLIEELFNSDVLKLVKNHQNPLAAAAYLIAKWIEKNFPQKQYTLISLPVVVPFGIVDGLILHQ